MLKKLSESVFDNALKLLGAASFGVALMLVQQAQIFWFGAIFTYLVAAIAAVSVAFSTVERAKKPFFALETVGFIFAFLIVSAEFFVPSLLIFMRLKTPPDDKYVYFTFAGGFAEKGSKSYQAYLGIVNPFDVPIYDVSILTTALGQYSWCNINYVQIVYPGSSSSSSCKWDLGKYFITIRSRNGTIFESVETFLDAQGKVSENLRITNGSGVILRESKTNQIQH